MKIEVKDLKSHEQKSRETTVNLIDDGKLIKCFKNPTYFPTVDRVGDMRDIIDAKVKLEQMGDKNLPHINGLVIEAHRIPIILTDQLKLTKQMRLTKRSKGQDFKDFYEYINEYDLFFFIDPNLDRIDISSTYGKWFLRLHENFGPSKNFFTNEIIEKMINGQNVDPKLFLNPDFITRVLRLQKKYKADIFLPPYSSINLRTFSKDLSINLELFSSAEQINKFVFQNEKPLIPVMCLHTNIFKAKKNKSGKRSEWSKLIESFEKIESNIIILKITNFDILSPSENYKGILSFFRELKDSTNKIIIFLNMNEFAYILIREGLDIYSSRMSRSGMDIPKRGIEPPPRYGKYYVPRKMILVNFDEIEELPCSCPFCDPYSNGKHKSLSESDWNSLRIYHFVYLKNEELGMLNREMKKKCMRVALRDIFADSEIWKNFTEFI